jgi:hypothetical protein
MRHRPPEAPAVAGETAHRPDEIGFSLELEDDATLLPKRARQNA